MSPCVQGSENAIAMAFAKLLLNTALDKSTAVSYCRFQRFYKVSKKPFIHHFLFTYRFQ